jgi:hypothetical protein
MKLRIKCNSMRLRLGPSEIRRLLADGRIEESIRFAADEGATLTYALELSASCDEPVLRYEPHAITVLIPYPQAREWSEGDEVGIAGRVAAGAETLDLLIEKDFACIDRDDHENEDTFPNPKAGAVC